MSLHSCDMDFIYAYRERIAVSDGTVVCCETNIVIPAGFPYADCRPQWWYESHKEPPPQDEPDLMPTDELLPHLTLRPQALEVWRHLRNDSLRRGTCPCWGHAVQDYLDEVHYSYEKHDRIAYARLARTINRTRARYEDGLPPRLHPHEKASLASGEFVRALPYSLRPRKKDA